jgi:hypothetical protein
MKGSTTCNQDRRTWADSLRNFTKVGRLVSAGWNLFHSAHRFTTSFNYLPPAPTARALRTAFGGWQLNDIVTIQSGQPFTPYTRQFDPYTNDSFNRLVVTGNLNTDVPNGYAYNPAASARAAVTLSGASGATAIAA